MKNASRIIGFIFAFALSLNLVNAFGYFRKNYDVFDFMGMHGFGLFAGFGLIVVIAALFLFVFWLWMLIDCLKRDFKKDIDKVIWILAIIFLHILGALLYYFIVNIF